MKGEVYKVLEKREETESERGGEDWQGMDYM